MKGIFINEVGNEENGLFSTAFDDYSIRHLPQDTIILHCFQHNGINMGWDDTRHPNIEKGLKYYQEHNVPVTIRSAGGRSIVADEGVLNVSITIQGKYSMVEAYDYFENFLKEAFAPFSKDVVSKEIQGAYCPGDTDLSIDGKKFCGTAQRRRKDVINLVCYISINGDQNYRSNLVKGFYEIMGDDTLKINPEVMECLDKLAKKPISVQDIADSLLNVLKQRTDSYEEISGYDTHSEDFIKSYEYTLNKNKIIMNR